MNDTTHIETETPQRNGEAGRLLGAAHCSAWLDRPATCGLWWLYRRPARGLSKELTLVFVDGSRMSFDRQTWYTITRYLSKQPEAQWMRIVPPSIPLNNRITDT
jgi:hypothetical protein